MDDEMLKDAPTHNPIITLCYTLYRAAQGTVQHILPWSPPPPPVRIRTVCLCGNGLQSQSSWYPRSFSVAPK